VTDLRNETTRLAELVRDLPNDLMQSITGLSIYPGLSWPINIRATGDEATAHRWHLFVGGYRMGGAEVPWRGEVCGDNGVTVTVTEADARELIQDIERARTQGEP
jgi:hypothetical protein